MGKSRKSQGYQDPLDSIFGFIFGNAKSKPVRTRPTRIKPGNASQDLARGLAEIAAAPANFAGDMIQGAINEAPDSVGIVNIATDKRDGKLYRNMKGTKVEITAAGFVGALKDPNKLIDKVFTKSADERKWARFLNAGRGLDTALLAVWAKKQGFDNKESTSIGFAASNLLGSEQALEARKKYAQNMTVGFLHKKGITKGELRNVLQGLEGYKGANIRSEADLRNILSGIPAIASRADFTNLTHDLYENYAKGVTGDPSAPPSVGRAWNKNLWETEGKINRDGYISIMRDNYGQRAALLDALDPVQAVEQRRLLAAQHALDNVLKIKGPGFDGINSKAFGAHVTNVHKQITYWKGEIIKSRAPSVDEQRILNKLNVLETQMSTDATNAANFLARKEKRRIFGFPVVGDYTTYKNLLIKSVDAEIEIVELRKLAAQTSGDLSEVGYLDNMRASLEDKRNALQTAPFRDWRITMADMTGAYRSMDKFLLKGGFVGGFLSGELFGDAYMSPAAKAGIHFNGSWGGNVMVPREDIHAGYAALTNLYYFTPGSLAKTFLYNGEAFGMLLFKQRQKSLSRFLSAANQASIMGAISSNPALATALKDFLSPDGSSLNMSAIVANLPGFVDGFGAHGTTLGPIWTQLQALYNTDQKGVIAIALKVFGSPERTFSAFSGWLSETKVMKGVNEVLKGFWKKVLGDSLGTRVAGLGLQQAVSVVVQELLVALGVATGGLGTALAFVLTTVGEGLVSKVLKPMLKLFMLFLWSVTLVVIALLCIIPILIWKGAYPTPQGHLPPMDMMECTNDNGFADLYKYTKPVHAGNYGNAPADSTCPIIASPLQCMQGNGAGATLYHLSRQSLDIATTSEEGSIWYAPSDGTVVAYNAPLSTPTTTSGNCPGISFGGEVVFQDKSGTTYNILHVVALASGAVKKGEPVARALGSGELQASGCWSGPHFHLDVQSGGGFVDAETWYKEQLKCDIEQVDPTCNG